MLSRLDSNAVFAQFHLMPPVPIRLKAFIGQGGILAYWAGYLQWAAVITLWIGSQCATGLVLFLRAEAVSDHQGSV
jgi:hypothetical protein